MRSNADKLLTLCGFYKEATLEEDMAKRIMLSVIPAVMSGSERHHSGGFDYKALKSAANGAKDLVKYGTKACVGEMEHYGVGIRREYEDLINHSSIRDFDDEKYAKLKALKARSEQIGTKKQAVKDLEQNGKYKDCLKLMTDCFNEEEAFEQSYGGRAWAKISHTLYQIEEKRELLNLIRNEAKSTSPDPKTDYPTLEVETMRDIVVLMNVFDGLAHNTASVMPKVVQEEIDEYNSNNPRGRDDDDEYDRNHSDRQYQKRIKNLMDAKEIDDPFTVYKEVQSIIEHPQNRNLFGDWITRIRSNPEFQTAKTLRDRRGELAVIQLRKTLKDNAQHMDNATQNISTIKDRILNTHNDKAKQELFGKLYFQISEVRNRVFECNELIRKQKGSTQSGAYQLQEAISRIGLEKYINSMLDKADNARYCGECEYMDNDNSLISDITRLKRMVSALPGLIDQYIVNVETTTTN